MTATALEIARERQLDWLLDELLGDRQPRDVRREARTAMPRWLVAALIVLAIGAAVGVALHEDPGKPVRPTPVQDPAPAGPWHDCTSPAELDQVPADVVNLRCFDFDDATLTKLDRFEKLQRLDLSKSLPDQNGVTRSVAITDAGVAHLDALTSLQWLSLAGCWQIEGKTLGQLRSIPRLEHLDLAYTNVTTSGVARLSTLPSLRELVLSGCIGFHGSALTAIAKIPGLRRLELSACASLSAADVASLRSLSELRYLDLTNCCGFFLGQRAAAFDDFGPDGRQEPKEKQPVEDGIGVTDEAVSALRDLPIQTLLLHGCRALTDEVAAPLAAMKHLRHLDVGNLRKTTTAILSALPTDLTSLSLQANNHYDAAGLDALQRFTRITSLDISGLTAIEDAQFAKILKGKPLVTLKMGGTPKSRDAMGARGHYLPALTVRSAAALVNHPTLESLDLKATEWMDAAAARQLVRLPNLRRLQLVWCKNVDANALVELRKVPLENVDLFGIGASDREARELAKVWPGCDVRLPKGARISIAPY